MQRRGGHRGNGGDLEQTLAECGTANRWTSWRMTLAMRGSLRIAATSATSAAAETSAT